MIIRKRSCCKINMVSGGVALVSLLGGKDRKGPLLSVLSKTWKIIIALSECNDTSSSETLDLRSYWKWIWSFKGPNKFIPFRWLLVHMALPVDHSLKGNATPNLQQCGFCHEAQETTKHVLWSCPFAQKVWNKVMSLFQTIYASCLFSWGSMMWGELHSNLMLYEANNVHEAMTIHNRRLILVSPFQQPRKQVRLVQIWKTVTTTMLWVLWKYRCNRLYDTVDIYLSDVLLEIWGNLLAVVCGQYDNMQGSPCTMNKRRK